MCMQLNNEPAATGRSLHCGLLAGIIPKAISEVPGRLWHRPRQFIVAALQQIVVHPDRSGEADGISRSALLAPAVSADQEE
jgi:hypothetical protein